jgi:hypothetical protein
MTDDFNPTEWITTKEAVEPGYEEKYDKMVIQL